MILGSRKHGGIRFERALWGAPASITLFAVRDKCAGPGNIPWRYWRRINLRSPVSVRILRMWVSATERVPYAAEITTGWGMRHTVRHVPFPRWMVSALWWAAARRPS